MKNKILFSVFALVAWSATASAAEKYDASIVSMEGNVLVSQGEAYRTATPGMDLKQGDRVMIMDGAELSMKYPDGCNFTFKDGQIIEIGGISVCAMTSTGFVSATSAQYVQAAPGTGDDDDNDKAAAAASSGGVSPVTAGLIIAGAAAAIYLVTRDDDDNSVSPPPPPAVPPPPPVRPPKRPVSP